MKFFFLMTNTFIFETLLILQINNLLNCYLGFLSLIIFCTFGLLMTIINNLKSPILPCISGDFYNES